MLPFPSLIRANTVAFLGRKAVLEKHKLKASPPGCNLNQSDWLSVFADKSLSFQRDALNMNARCLIPRDAVLHFGSMHTGMA